MFEYDGYRDYYGYWSKHVNEYGKRTRTMLNAVKLGSFIDQEFRNCACDNVLAEYKKVPILALWLCLSMQFACGKHGN